MFTGFEDCVPSWMPINVMADDDHKSQLGHIFKVFNGMQKLQQNKILCDITIKVEERTFQAHKVVLAACSEYFAAMLTSDFQESLQSEAVIPGNTEAFQILLDFTYSGTLNLSLDTVIDVLEMAHYLQFDIVLQRCHAFLNCQLQRVEGDNFDIEIVVRILTKADLFGFEDLKSRSKEYLAKNFKMSEKFLLHMTPELMKEMLERSDLNDEKEVFDTTLAWLQHDWQERKEYASSLFQRIRLGTVPLGHLSKTVFKSPDLYAIPECKQMIDRTLELHDSLKQGDPPLYNIDPGLFATRTTTYTILGIGDPAMYYDTELESWVTLKNFPKLPKKDCFKPLDTCINAGGTLFVARDAVRLPHVLKCPQFLKLDIANNIWQPLQPMTRRATYSPLVFLDSNIYVIGTVVPGVQFSQLCEVYSIRNNTWNSIASLPKCVAVGHLRSCAVYDGSIFVYAMDFEQRNHLQMYDPVTDSWSVLMTCQHCITSTYNIGLVVSNGKCYRVISGNCECKVEGCQWHEINVHELVINAENKNASVVDKQDQSLLPEMYRKRFFCINGEVFTVFRGKFHNIGVTAGDNRQMFLQQLHVWWKLFPCDTSVRLMQTTFTLDKTKWL
ncbi:kelch-like protein 28 isoform X2 [Amphiura filiformis]|uniref:kelch-like protein 28 isoform X2 n=1 Tax=Amphiura filiformis TaxID=82378 RepID=UPI003B224F8A